MKHVVSLTAAITVVIALNQPANADSFSYGVGAVKCPDITIAINDHNDKLGYMIVSWVQGVLTVASAVKDVQVFPKSAMNDQPKYLISAVRIRCQKHPEWNLWAVTQDIVSAIDDNTESDMFTPFKPPSKKPTLYQ